MRLDRLFAFFVPAAAGLAVISTAAGARASAVAYPDGSYARVTREAAVVTWDAAAKTESLHVHLRIEGDAPTVAAIVPTPRNAAVQLAERDHEIIANDPSAAFKPAPDFKPENTLTRVTEFAKPTTPPLDTDELPLVRVLHENVAAIDGADPAALKRWLDEHHFAAGQGLLDWASIYEKRGWGFTVVEVANAGTGRRVLALPDMAITFPAEAPVVPYADAEPDFAAYNAYLARAGLCSADGGACSAPFERSFDVYVASNGVARATRHEGVDPILAQVIEATPDVFARLFPGQAPPRARWTLTHYVDASSTHQGTDDFVLAVAAAPAASAASHAAPRTTHHPARVLFAFVALLAAAAIGVALRGDRERAG